MAVENVRSARVAERPARILKACSGRWGRVSTPGRTMRASTPLRADPTNRSTVTGVGRVKAAQRYRRSAASERASLRGSRSSACNASVGQQSNQFSPRAKIPSVCLSSRPGSKITKVLSPSALLMTFRLTMPASENYRGAPLWEQTDQVVAGIEGRFVSTVCIDPARDATVWTIRSAACELPIRSEVSQIVS